MAVDDQWVTLRELDERLGAGKGTSFIAFKRLLPEAQEGRDFRVLDALQETRTIARLHSAGRIYASTVNAVLLSPNWAARVQASLSE